MENNIAPIVVKKEGVSDDFYKVLERYKSDGDWVDEGDLLLCFETSKIAIDVEAPMRGYVFYDAVVDDEIKIGQTIAVITQEKTFSSQEWFQFVNKSNNTKIKKEETTIKVSKPAQKLIDQYAIDSAVFKDISIITRADVEHYINNTIPANAFENMTLDKESVVIYGGGGHAQVCIDLLKQTKSHKVIGALDDNIPLNTHILNIPIIGNLMSIDKLVEKGLRHVILGIGAVLNNAVRKEKFSTLKKKGLYVPNLIHPSASVELSADIGEGNQIMQGAIIGSNVKIGDNCIINSGTIISHDCIIGDNVHIAPGAVIAGGVTIKNDTVIGMGTTIFLGLTIGKNVIIHNGAHIFRDIEDHCIVKGDTASR